MDTKTNVYGVLILATLGLAGFWYARTASNRAGSDVHALAQCLAEKKVTMYGADWCPHCQNERAAFGDAFKQVPYVECPANPAACLAQDIKGYPTWIFPDGRRLVGEQGLEKLAKESGCPFGSAKK